MRVPIESVHGLARFLEHLRPLGLEHIGCGAFEHVRLGEEGLLEQREPLRLFGSALAEVEVGRHLLFDAHAFAQLYFKRTPSASLEEDVLSAASRHVARCKKLCLESILGEKLVQRAVGFRLRRVPFAVDLFGVRLKRAVCLEPFPCGLGRHRQRLILRVRKPRLKLDVETVAVVGGHVVLPAFAACALTPDEELAPLKT